MKRKRKDGRTGAGTRPSRNVIIARTCHLARGKVQVNIAQGKHFVARFWDVLGAMPAEDVAAVVAAELRSAAKRRLWPNLS